MSLTFHETFSLDLGNLSRLMEAVSLNSFISDGEIQDETGVGNQKVNPTIKYAGYCGLISKKQDSPRELYLTKFGEIVFKFDKYLTSPVTHWAIHYYLSSKKNGAAFWAYFIYGFLPKNNQFTKQNIKDSINFLDSTLSTRSKNSTTTVLLNSYLNNEGIYKTRLIAETERDNFNRQASYNPNVYLAGFILASLWEEHYGGKSMIGLETLFEDGYFAAAMNMGGEEVEKCLKALGTANFIEQMREAPPYEIRKKWSDKFNLLEKAYNPS